MNPVLLILGALVLVVFANLLLITLAQSQAKNTKGGTIKKMLSSIREPFTEGDSDLDELAGLMSKLDPDLTSNEDESA